MYQIKEGTLFGFLKLLLLNFRNYKKKKESTRCKLVGIETIKSENQLTLFVMINGIKKQIISFTPDELVIDDKMLSQFSWFDVRAITFYALNKVNASGELLANSKIIGQEISCRNTIFIIEKINHEGVYRRTANELYCDQDLFNQFNYEDIKNIISTAIQEQTLEDIERMNNAEHID